MILRLNKGKFYYSEIWTNDLQITVPVLYQLSYLALCWQSPYFVSTIPLLREASQKLGNIAV